MKLYPHLNLSGTTRTYQILFCRWRGSVWGWPLCTSLRSSDSPRGWSACRTEIYTPQRLCPRARQPPRGETYRWILFSSTMPFSFFSVFQVLKKFFFNTGHKMVISKWSSTGGLPTWIWVLFSIFSMVKIIWCWPLASYHSFPNYCGWNWEEPGSNKRSKS